MDTRQRISYSSQPGTLPPTLGPSLDRLLEHVRGQVARQIRSPATLAMHEAHSRWLRGRLDCDLPLGELTSPALVALAESWVTSGGVGRGLSVKTVAKRLVTLRRAMRLAVARGEIDMLPLFPEIGLPPHRARNRIMETVTDLQRLRAALSPERADWVAVAVWTCQRPGDVERLRWSEVNVSSDTPWMIIRSTKTRKPDGIRVKMPRPMISVLEDRRARLTAAGSPPRATDLIVRPWPNRSCVLPVVCCRIGLPPMSAMDLRHTGISWMVRRLGLTRAAQEWGGWSDFNMMSRYYAHALPAGLAQASDELASMAEEAA